MTRAGLLLLAAALGGCSGHGTFVHVTVAPGGRATAGVFALDLQLALAGGSAQKSYRENGGGEIKLPADMVLQIGSASGELTVTAIARDAAGNELDRGSNVVTVVRGKTVELPIVLGSNAQPTVPSVPQSFTATADLALGATLRWSAPASDGGSALTGYTITADPPIAQLDVGPMTTQAPVTGLTAGTTYTFTLVANNAVGSSPGATAMVTIVDVPAPVATACRYNSQNRVFWHPVANASGYNVYFATSPGVTAASSKAGAMVASPFNHSSLTNGTTYYYRVSAIVGGVEGGLSNEVSATPATYVVPTNTVYAVNHTLNNQGAVYIWDTFTAAPGNTPSRTITGMTNTNLSAPIVGVFVDREAGLLYVANGELNNTAPPSRRINVYSTAANGDVAPLRTMQDGALQRVRGVAVDLSRNILYVANQASGASQIVSIDDACHFAGTPTARALIAGTTSQLYFPTQIALNEATDELYVANYNNVLVFKNISTLSGTPTVAPDRVITLTGVTLENQGVAVDPTLDVLYIAHQGRFNTPAKTVFSLDSASTVNGQVAATRTINMVPTFGYPVGIHVAADRLLVGCDTDGPFYITSWPNAHTINGSPPAGAATVTPSSMYTGLFSGVFYVP